MKPEDVIEQVIDIATEAGQKIRDIYLKGNFKREIKSDNTPV
ncbi:MAG: 3'(2'), 5'-bisphosphate nucleotidase, partial [Cellvibrionaceae bacterium]